MEDEEESNEESSSVDKAATNQPNSPNRKKAKRDHPKKISDLNKTIKSLKEKISPFEEEVKKREDKRNQGE